jgi:Fe-S cluster assembly iron-binding protein IscA
MALDESKKDDKVFTEKGLSFVINEGLFQEVQPITIDFIESYGGGRYVISSSLSATTPSCGSTCCSC